jgi:hypothetical protein
MNMPETKSKFPAQFTFSQSSLQDYADCPRRFQLRLPGPAHLSRRRVRACAGKRAPQLEGQHFHRLAQQYLLGIPAENWRGWQIRPTWALVGEFLFVQSSKSDWS